MKRCASDTTYIHPLTGKNSDGDTCLYLDAFIIGEEQLSKLFGFARSYFMVDTDQPVRYLDYLCRLLPNARWERLRWWRKPSDSRRLPCLAGKVFC